MLYILPQVQVFQVFRQLPQNVIQSLNAFVFGPHYQLYRYSEAAEKAQIGLGAYVNDTDTAYAYPAQPDGSVVDTTYSQLYMDNLLAQYATVADTLGARVLSSDERNKIRIDSVVVKTTAASARSALLKSRDVKAGDAVRYTYQYTSGMSTVLAIETDETPAAVGTATGSGSLAAIVSGGAYDVFTGPKDTTYTLLVVSATSIKITDSAGTDGVQYVTPVSGVAFDVGGYGATATITFASLVPGDMAYVPCTIAVAGDAKTIVLEDDVDSDITTSDDMTLELFLPQTAKAIPAKRIAEAGVYNWLDVDGEITVNSGIQVQDASFYDADPTDLIWMDVESADLYIQYRALLANYADTIHAMETIDDVATTLGTVTPDNPLAQGVYNAVLNSGNRTVYYMAVPSVDLTGFSSVLDKATLSSNVYAFAPLSRDSEIRDAVTAHVMAESTETEKRWRIGFYGSVLAESKNVYTASTNPTGDDFLATITAYGTGYTLLKFVNADGMPSTVTKALADLKANDKIKIGFTTDPWGESTNEEYLVLRVLTNTTLLLKTGPATPYATPSKVEAIHPYTLAEMADAMAAASSFYYNRRVYSVFPSTAYSGGVAQTSEFVAAAVAGLCSSVPPQQGLTNIELLGFDDLPMVYSTFSRTQLNKMAEYGSLIVMQDVVGGTVYIRHQVSTAASSNNLNLTELNVTKNLDSISYYFASVLTPYIGRYNVTPELLGAIKTTLYDGMSYLGSFTSIGLLGPQIDLENTKIVTLQQHPTLKDTIVCTMDVGMPYPFNVMQLSLVV